MGVLINFQWFFNSGFTNTCCQKVLWFLMVKDLVEKESKEAIF